MLTEKERKVLELRKKGLKQTQIASKLEISQSAVSAFESNALRKLKDAKEIMKFMEKMRIKLDES